MNSLSFDNLHSAITGTACAFRSRTRMQPAGGPGEKLFPPTHLNGEYASEQRKVVDADGDVRTSACVLLDSVQSNANRAEEALQIAIDAGRIKIPLVRVDFDDSRLESAVGSLSTLQVPHRLADAILRDSSVNEDGKAVGFRQSQWGRRLDVASLSNATPIFEISPTSLLYGMWDSTGPKGGLGAKFQRAVVGEIIAIDVEIGKKTSSRIDPLGIRSQVGVKKIDKDEYEVVPVDKGKKPKGLVAPSEINHGNIPPTIVAGGITCGYAEHSFVLSLAALRRLRFPIDGQWSAEADAAGQSVLAAIGLMGAALAAEAGYDLRSRCLLWPDDVMSLQLLSTPGVKPESFELTGDAAIEVYSQAVTAAKNVGLPYREEPIVLQPKESLMKLLIESQRLATAEDAEN